MPVRQRTVLGIKVKRWKHRLGRARERLVSLLSGGIADLEGRGAAGVTTPSTSLASGFPGAFLVFPSGVSSPDVGDSISFGGLESSLASAVASADRFKDFMAGGAECLRSLVNGSKAFRVKVGTLVIAVTKEDRQPLPVGRLGVIWGPLRSSGRLPLLSGSSAGMGSGSS